MLVLAGYARVLNVLCFSACGAAAIAQVCVPCTRRPKNEANVFDCPRRPIPCPEKRCHYIFASNFVKRWPILIILSPTDLAVHFWLSDNKMPHHASNVLLHYLM